MRVLGFILAACLALAVLRAVAAVLLMALAGGFAVALVAQPAATIGFVLVLVIAENPGLLIWALALSRLGAAINRARGH